ncbi:type II toxin-antitoxin system RelE/ParE family toxin [Pseudomonas fluorescens]|uniref:type II toxin-antitoxin system RelE/ParE family toxin n=1 Tax=Pseudomonas fluorescens TaxID=294 RepID=UPI00113219CA|nr:type II toxin-antitoxin system RelE/ParE family toxin [Pseudomonas fluorescens]TMU83109.1 type II toxin-antitoxin system RelE/ParE family toxin [Pseudomonas fluorescens]
MAEYRLTPAAEGDLEAIWSYTAQQWGLDQANRYIDMITAAFEQLAERPKTALACDAIRPGYRRCSVERHMIYFRITAYGIAIIRVLHDRREAQRNL